MIYDIANPKPSSLIESLRSVGYSLPAAIADIVDNSLAAEAGNIWIDFHWAGSDAYISIIDNGHGMSEDELYEAMRPGSRSPLEERDPSDLGRFGLGLKTASFSQCRKLTVLSRLKNGPSSTRTWDLDYVVKYDEWRLLKTMDLDSNLTKKLEEQDSGTLVLWRQVDRLTRGEIAGDAAAHNRFNDSIDAVRQHLAMTFHRFIEERSIEISLNGHSIDAWNPFLETHTATYKTPEEAIPYGHSEVLFRGFVLPHKDMLTSEQYLDAAGPSGWNAHQGFYVYRSKRLIVSGDWLRLGRPNPWTKAEHYNLARIRLDLPNDTDIDWQIDVKKSSARPPALIRERLTELAENIRIRARAVFVHRGRYGARMPKVDDFERPWESVIRNGKRMYRINRNHPAVRLALQTSGTNSPEIDSMLRILEETVPVQQVWLDIAEQELDAAKPYEDIEYSLIKADMRRAYECLVNSGINNVTAREQLKNIEPYNWFPQLIKEL